MAKPTILVTGATGKTGGAVAEQLLSQGWAVRALVHRDDQRSARLKKLGADVRIVSAHDPEQNRDALKGVQRAYYVPIFSAHSLQAASAFAAAAEQSNLEVIVQLSQWLSAPAHPSIMTRETWLIDHTFARLRDIGHIIVNPGMFADNFLRVVDMATLLGVFPVFTGDSRSAPVSNEDIAACVCALLADPDPHLGQSFRPTGPKLMNGSELANVIGKVIGRRVVPVSLPFFMFLKVAWLDGLNPHEALSWRDYVRDHREGAFEIGVGVTDVVRRLTGGDAESFEATARRYIEKPFARRTAKNLLRMVGKMAILPLVPSLNIDRYARQRGFPIPPTARLSSRDPQWRLSHGADALPVAGE